LVGPVLSFFVLDLFADLSRDVFKHYFFHHLQASNSLLIVHAVMTIMIHFVEIAQASDYSRLIDQLFRLIEEPLLCV